jgi:diaminopimelate decarboxylase
VDLLGGFAEIVSDMEYELAKRIGVKSEKIIFNGPYKNTGAIRELLLSGGTVNIDSFYELPIISEIAKINPDKRINIGIRCNFDIKDGVISRFGFDVTSKDFIEALTIVKRYKNIHLMGFHCHFACRKLETWALRSEGIMELIKNQLDTIPEMIDLGGGLFGKMGASLKAQFDSYIPSYEEYAKAAAGVFAKEFSGEEKPVLFIEPGSALAGDAMKFVSKVINIKTIRGKSIATLLGSVYNINPTLNHKNPPITIYSNEAIRKEYETMDFGGFTCIESDYLYQGYNGKLAAGDYVVFDNVGSYSIVLKPPFILPNFSVVEYDDETHKVELIKRQETFEDIFRTFIF